jgi:putative copper export protein
VRSLEIGSTSLSGLASPVETVRLFLHVLAATVWVGGQIVLLGLLPTARQLGPEAPKRLADAFARLAWPAYAVLVITGFWNISTFTFADQTTSWKIILVVKIVVVALAGLATVLHTRAKSKRALAFWGGVAGLSSVAALLFGILLAGP